jgi:hypothetical protein
MCPTFHSIDCCGFSLSSGQALKVTFRTAARPPPLSLLSLSIAHQPTNINLNFLHPPTSKF